MVGICTRCYPHNGSRVRCPQGKTTMGADAKSSGLVRGLGGPFVGSNGTRAHECCVRDETENGKGQSKTMPRTCVDTRECVRRRGKHAGRRGGSTPAPKGGDPNPTPTPKSTPKPKPSTTSARSHPPNIPLHNDEARTAGRCRRACACRVFSFPNPLGSPVQALGNGPAPWQPRQLRRKHAAAFFFCAHFWICLVGGIINVCGSRDAERGRHLGPECTCIIILQPVAVRHANMSSSLRPCM